MIANRQLLKRAKRGSARLKSPEVGNEIDGGQKKGPTVAGRAIEVLGEDA